MLKLTFFIVIIFFDFIGCIKEGIVNPQIFDEKSYRVISDKNYQVEIEVDVFGQTFTLRMGDDDQQFMNKKFEDSGVFYVQGFAFLGREEVGAAFGEFRKGSKHFVGQFRRSDEVFYTDQDPTDNSLFVFKASDQPKDENKIPRGDKTLSPVSLDKETTSSLGLGRTDNIGHICPLKITVDNTLYKKMGRDKTSITSSVKRLVQALNMIYQDNRITVNRESSASVKFQLEELVIADSCFISRHISCSSYEGDPDSFLKKHSRDNHDAYCLSYMLTSHPFEQTLGVAYVGGICSKYGRFQDSKTGQKESRSINSGFITIENPEIGLAQAEHTLAHEIGHNFGSDHDREACGSGYLMAPFAPNGQNSKSRQFSDCSKRQIKKRLDDISQGFSRNCFVEESRSTFDDNSFDDSAVETTTKKSSWFREWINKYRSGNRFSLSVEEDAKESEKTGTILSSVFSCVFIVGFIVLLVFAFTKQRWCFAKNPDQRWQNRASKRIQSWKVGLKGSNTIPPKAHHENELSTVKMISERFQQMTPSNSPKSSPKLKRPTEPPPTPPLPKAQSPIFRPGPTNLDANLHGPNFKLPAPKSPPQLRPTNKLHTNESVSPASISPNFKTPPSPQFPILKSGAITTGTRKEEQSEGHGFQQQSPQLKNLKGPPPKLPTAKPPKIEASIHAMGSPRLNMMNVAHFVSVEKKSPNQKQKFVEDYSEESEDVYKSPNPNPRPVVQIPHQNQKETNSKPNVNNLRKNFEHK